MQSIEYTVQVEDIVAFNDHHHRASPHSKRLVSRLQVVCALAVAAACFLPLQAGTPPLHIGPWLAVGIAFVIAVPALFHGAVRRSARRQLAEGHNRGVLGPRRLEIRDDFLVEISELGEQHTRWRAVEKVMVAPGHVFIYLSATAGHTVPRTAFGDAAALQAFVALVRGRMALTAGLPMPIL